MRFNCYVPCVGRLIQKEYRISYLHPVCQDSNTLTIECMNGLLIKEGRVDSVHTLCYVKKSSSIIADVVRVHFVFVHSLLGLSVFPCCFVRLTDMEAVVLAVDWTTSVVCVRAVLGRKDITS